MGKSKLDGGFEALLGRREWALLEPLDTTRARLCYDRRLEFIEGNV